MLAETVGTKMKCVRFFAIMAAILLFLPAVVAAKNKDEGKLQLTASVQLGATQLKPGEYKVEWTHAGSGVKVNFLQNDKTVVTTSGKVVELKHPSPYDAVVLKPTKSGHGKTIDEIDFDNRTEALQIEPTMRAPSRASHNR
jgi:hypothetical protein